MNITEVPEDTKEINIFYIYELFLNNKLITIAIFLISLCSWYFYYANPTYSISISIEETQTIDNHFLPNEINTLRSFGYNNQKYLNEFNLVVTKELKKEVLGKKLYPNYSYDSKNLNLTKHTIRGENINDSKSGLINLINKTNNETNNNIKKFLKTKSSELHFIKDKEYEIVLLGQEFDRINNINTLEKSINILEKNLINAKVLGYTEPQYEYLKNIDDVWKNEQNNPQSIDEYSINKSLIIDLGSQYATTFYGSRILEEELKILKKKVDDLKNYSAYKYKTSLIVKNKNELLSVMAFRSEQSSPLVGPTKVSKLGLNKGFLSLIEDISNIKIILNKLADSKKIVFISYNINNIKTEVKQGQLRKFSLPGVLIFSFITTLIILLFRSEYKKYTIVSLKS